MKGLRIMNKVYALGINNFDALDGHITSADSKLFFDKKGCEKWIKEEAKRQSKNGFKLVPELSSPDSWVFIKETLHGDYRHEFFGQYREVIN